MEDCLNKEKQCSDLCCRSQRIYVRLQDEVSRTIFTQRVLYSMTKNPEFIKDIVKTTPEGKWFCDFMTKNDNFFLFGGGYYGRAIVKDWKKSFKGIVDNNNNLWGKTVCGIPVEPPDILKNVPKDVNVLITTRLYFQEIKSQLLDIGVSEAQIINIGEIQNKMTERMYFDLPQLSHDNEEAFVDVGAFDGTNTLDFIRWSGDFSHCYCLEADETNIKKCEKKLSRYIETGKVSIISKAAWSENTILRFSQNTDVGSCISDSGETEIKAEAVDNILDGKHISFIKMDIEGAELRALYGCRNIIQRQKPKLAISVYHKAQDIVSLADFILSLNPDYKLYLRHYTITEWDTVLYAIP